MPKEAHLDTPSPSRYRSAPLRRGSTVVGSTKTRGYHPVSIAASRKNIRPLTSMRALAMSRKTVSPDFTD